MKGNMNLSDEFKEALVEAAAPPASKFIRCEDGSYLTIAHVTRWFVVEDGVTRKGEIKASIPGPAHPFTIARYDDKHTAIFKLAELIVSLEG